MKNAKPANPYAAPSVAEVDSAVRVSEQPPTRAQIVFSLMAFGYAGLWLAFLFLYIPAFDPFDLRDTTLWFRLGTSCGTVLAVICTHHLAHRWWHILALLPTTMLLLAQASIWIQH